MGSQRIEYANCVCWVNRKGQYHREDGPAVEWSSGRKVWMQNNQYHRTDGPAVEWADGTKEWWVEGKEITQDSPKWPQLLKNALMTSIAMCFLMLQNDPEILSEDKQVDLREIEEEFTQALSEIKELESASPLKS